MPRATNGPASRKRRKRVLLAHVLELIAVALPSVGAIELEDDKRIGAVGPGMWCCVVSWSVRPKMSVVLTPWRGDCCQKLRIQLV